MAAIDHRANWTANDDGTMVPRRTSGSVKRGFNSSDFTLVCKFCGDDYGNEPDLPIGVVAAHFAKYHPEVGSHVQLDMLWLGQGPAPVGTSPTFASDS